MIDLDRMDAELESAVSRGGTRPVVSAHAPIRPRRPGHGAPAEATASEGSGIRDLLEQGRLGEVDAQIATHARRAVTAEARRDAATWAGMRALLDGRRDATHAGIACLLGLARATGDAGTWDRYWTQRFRAAIDGGDAGERAEVLDHCRERAYRFDDLPWWGSLTLLLAESGKGDEATRAFDAALGLLGGTAHAGVPLDILTDLIEAAAVLDDRDRAVLALRSLDCPPGRLVVVGPAVVCKGSVERYRALGLAARGRPVEAAECFRMAADAHRAMGAGPLLDRTHRQADRLRRAA